MDQRIVEDGKTREINIEEENFGRWVLKKPLGGGAIAFVYLAENIETRQQAAFKVARADIDSDGLRRFREEGKTLLELEKREGTKSHYFPRVLYPREVSSKGQYRGADGIWHLLVLEFVQGRPLEEIAAEYPGGRLPEPLALEVAAQYADMLVLLHSSGRTCADRKLSDLRWLSDNTNPNRGQLTVLDWNVVSEGDVGRPLDLFRFGIFWYELLLGTKPQFRKPEQQGGSVQDSEWRLFGRLEQHPAWGSLSVGTQGILAKLLHPIPEHRYRDADSLRRDVQAQLALWQREIPELLKSLADVRQNPRDGFKVADVIRLRAGISGAHLQLPPDFSAKYEMLKNQAGDETARYMKDLAEALRAGQIEKAKSMLPYLEPRVAYNPENALRFERYRLLTEAYSKSLSDKSLRSPSDGETRIRLVSACEQLDNVDSIKTVQQTLQEVEERYGDFTREIAGLVDEARLHALMQDGEAMAEESHYQEAVRTFEEAEEVWKRLPSGIRTNLGYLMEEPSRLRKRYADRYLHEEKPRRLLIDGLKAASEGDYAQALERFDNALRLRPGDVFLRESRGLVQLWERFENAAKGQRLEAQIFVLSLIDHNAETEAVHLRKALRDPSTVAQAGLPGEDVDDFVRSVRTLYDNIESRKKEIADALVNDLLAVSARPKQEQVAPDTNPDYSNVDASIRFFLQWFPPPNDAGLVNGLCKVVQNLQDKVRPQLCPPDQIREDRPPVPGPQLAAKSDSLAQAAAYAELGNAITRILQECGKDVQWPAELSPDEVKTQKGALDRWLKHWRDLIAMYRRALEVDDMGLERDVLELAQRYGLAILSAANLTVESLRTVAHKKQRILELVNEASKLLDSLLDPDAKAPMEDAKAVEKKCEEATQQLEILQQQLSAETPLDDKDKDLWKTLGEQIDRLQTRVQTLQSLVGAWWWQLTLNTLAECERTVSERPSARKSQLSLLKKAEEYSAHLPEHRKSEASKRIEVVRERVENAQKYSAKVALEIAREWLEQGRRYLRGEEGEPPNPVLAIECAHLAREKIKTAEEAEDPGAAAEDLLRQVEDLLGDAKKALSEWSTSEVKRAVQTANDKYADANATPEEKNRLLDNLAVLLSAFPQHVALLSDEVRWAWRAREENLRLAREALREARNLEEKGDLVARSALVEKAYGLAPEDPEVKRYKEWVDSQWQDIKGKFDRSVGTFTQTMEKLRTKMDTIEDKLKRGEEDLQGPMDWGNLIAEADDALQKAKEVSPRKNEWEEELRQCEHELAKQRKRSEDLAGKVQAFLDTRTLIRQWDEALKTPVGPQMVSQLQPLIERTTDLLAQHRDQVTARDLRDLQDKVKGALNQTSGRDKGNVRPWANADWGLVILLWLLRQKIEQIVRDKEHVTNTFEGVAS